jgi:orotidine-5'-phosphate decarboxylase
MSMNTKDRIIVALDVDSRGEALGLVRRLKGQVGVFKIGSQLFVAEGPQLVHEILAMNERVFLDLKFHDIPNTVSKAVAAAGRMGVSMLTLHTLGGLPMLVSAARSLRESLNDGKRPLLLGVTVLTSMCDQDLELVGIPARAESQVVRLAALAVKAGLDGVIASPQEVSLLRSQFGGNLKIITPGIRPADASSDDQTRIATPGEAICAGADYLVIGRPITASPDPADSARRIVESIDLKTGHPSSAQG